jgi:hypothetical protein
MSPTIINDLHDKWPLNVIELAEYEVDIIKQQVFEHNIGPDELLVRFTIVEDDSKGTVSVELIDDNQLPKAIGNVDFKKLDKPGRDFINGVQITSAYFCSDYRGLGLGVKAYELIAKNYTLVSDFIQTQDGSAFWKFKLAAHEQLEIQIFQMQHSQQPSRVLDNYGIPIVYHYTKKELEPMIWGLESPSDAPHPSINASTQSKCADIVLVAFYKNQD